MEMNDEKKVEQMFNILWKGKTSEYHILDELNTDTCGYIKELCYNFFLRGLGVGRDEHVANLKEIAKRR
jgi:hypothetical protein